MSRRTKRMYSDDFKQQMVTLYLNGKPRAEIIREYELTPLVSINGSSNPKPVDLSKPKTIEPLKNKN